MKPPGAMRGAVPRPSMPVVQQQLLPFADLVSTAKPFALNPRTASRLWFAIWLPTLPLEAGLRDDTARAVVEEQQGIHRVLQSDAKASAAGVLPGQSANAALALLPTLQLIERNPICEQQALEALAAWLERFSSFVSIAGKNVLLLEIAGSVRLFGGLPSLRQEICQGLNNKGFSAAVAIAPTPMAATWLARAGQRSCIRVQENLAPALRKLAISCLEWPLGLCESLAGMGVSSVGDCLRLPREGFARRFGAAHLLELDRALGCLPDPRVSWRAAERFCADYEMTEEQSDSEVLLNICRQLLLSHEQFLLLRQQGTQRLCVSFFHLKHVATELYLGSAFADRCSERWFNLLRIHFEQLRLPEAVIAVRLRSGLPQAAQTGTAKFCFQGKTGQQTHRTSFAELAERLIARLGEQSVNAMTTVADHRPESAWRTRHPFHSETGPSSNVCIIQERPLWMLPEPALLATECGYPLHKGCRLTLLQGPERLETGWWDDNSISRDYYMAGNAVGIRLWVFRNRREKNVWYLHGFFG